MSGVRDVKVEWPVLFRAQAFSEDFGMEIYNHSKKEKAYKNKIVETKR